MRRIRWALAAAVVAIGTPTGASAQVLFYNGDGGGVNGTGSEVNTIVTRSMIYENFTIGGSGAFITGLFGDFMFTPTPSFTTAAWEVRSGVSNGNGGVLLFSGVTDIATSYLGTFNSLYDQYRVQASDMGSFFLASGVYWFGLSPIGDGTGRSFLQMTEGVNGVSANLDNQYVIDSEWFSYDFADSPLTGTRNYALGVQGRYAESVVPEPATVTLLATGLAGMAAARRRRRTT